MTIGTKQPRVRRYYAGTQSRLNRLLPVVEKKTDQASLRRIGLPNLM